MITNKTPLRFKEYIYLSIMWLLRHIFDSNYGKEKTKYNINSYEEYELAHKIALTGSRCKPDYPKDPRFIMTSISDFVILGDEVLRYERLNCIKWKTVSDKMEIEDWREFEKHGMKYSIINSLRTSIALEFL